ncbi:shikimate dehydrogenase [Dehalogenimonas alkenigignens]|uniref:Shikimate dehydrogenase (NADP(+)) n=1 Tax=Dehalogenimonas alkenigignens TaxID=1217799 RepID=A0A0W0GG19_9CHLR|nr:shikimate dehydrogenase [Dehalogenimonas alkenigignens]KTB47494.1 shikimate dehydrogenase [Dehalogenimonas alkenigignens]PVV83447.1 shikimate dehydrogenase [Dehalogenimonas alkenigignens]
MIDSNTRLIALLGDPVAHSVSPAMQNAAFAAAGLNFVYLAFPVPAAAVSGAVAGLRGLGIRGANITIPHKTAVMPFLDRIDDQARRIGAVNVILNDGGRLTGCNTDAPGFLAALKCSGFEPSGKKAVVIGAGGAARAVVFALRGAGASVAIVNRTRETAASLAADTGAAALPMTDAGFSEALAGASLVVNATSIGLSPDIEATPLPAKFLRQGLVVFDIVYRPQQTRLLRDAEAAGCQTIGGLEMLVEQGALAFELWAGQPAPRDVMSGAAAGALA